MGKKKLTRQFSVKRMVNNNDAWMYFKKQIKLIKIRGIRKTEEKIARKFTLNWIKKFTLRTIEYVSII